VWWDLDVVISINVCTDLGLQIAELTLTGASELLKSHYRLIQAFTRRLTNNFLSRSMLTNSRAPFNVGCRHHFDLT